MAPTTKVSTDSTSASIAVAEPISTTIPKTINLPPIKMPRSLISPSDRKLIEQLIRETSSPQANQSLQNLISHSSKATAAYADSSLKTPGFEKVANDKLELKHWTVCDDVGRLQKVLNLLRDLDKYAVGHPKLPDSPDKAEFTEYKKQTVRAVAEFQSWYNTLAEKKEILAVDGIVGDHTLGAIKHVLDTIQHPKSDTRHRPPPHPSAEIPKIIVNSNHPDIDFLDRAGISLFLHGNKEKHEYLRRLGFHTAQEKDGGILHWTDKNKAQGKAYRLDPKGFDFGDMADLSHGAVIGTSAIVGKAVGTVITVAGITAGIGASPVTGGFSLAAITGGVAAGMAISGGISALAEAGLEYTGKKLGYRSTGLNAGEIARAGAVGGVTSLLGPVAAPIAAGANELGESIYSKHSKNPVDSNPNNAKNEKHPK